MGSAMTKASRGRGVLEVYPFITGTNSESDILSCICKYHRYNCEQGAMKREDVSPEGG